MVVNIIWQMIGLMEQGSRSMPAPDRWKRDGHLNCKKTVVMGFRKGDKDKLLLEDFLSGLCLVRERIQGLPRLP